MFLRKIIQSDFVQVTRMYYVWIAYIFFIFLFTNGITSLDLIKNYHFTYDMLLTYGFMGFLFSIDSLIFAIIVAGLQISLKKWLKVDISSFIRILLIFGIGVTLINLFLIIFKKPIF
jgi:hypothetical protein